MTKKGKERRTSHRKENWEKEEGRKEKEAERKKKGQLNKKEFKRIQSWTWKKGVALIQQ